MESCSVSEAEVMKSEDEKNIPTLFACNMAEIKTEPALNQTETTAFVKVKNEDMCNDPSLFASETEVSQRHYASDLSCQNCTESSEASDLLHQNYTPLINDHQAIGVQIKAEETEAVYQKGLADQAVIRCHEGLSKLKKLESSNTRDKTYECNVCKMAFTHNSNLLHHQSIHSGEKPQPCECDHCEKAFTKKSIFVKHQRIHTGATSEDPYWRKTL